MLLRKDASLKIIDVKTALINDFSLYWLAKGVEPDISFLDHCNSRPLPNESL